MNKIRQQSEKNAKAQLIEHLLCKGAITHDVVIAQELALESFSRRADIALVNGSIEIFEIKSEADTLDRLPGQINVFSRYCDKLHVVSASRHIEKILSSTPKHVAVWEANEDVGIRVIRRGVKTPLKDKEVLVKLVNLKELRQILVANSLKPFSNRRKHLEVTAMTLSSNKLREGVLNALKKRYAETTENFLRALSSDKSVTLSHLHNLKRMKALPGAVDKPAHKDDYDTHLYALASQEDGIFGAPPEEIALLIKGN